MIKITNLNKTYDKGNRNSNHVLKDVSLTLPDTGFVCILGASGCGKTTLLNSIGGLDSFDNGTIETENVTAKGYGSRAMEAERNRNFGYIFQNYYLLSEHSVGYNVYIGLHSLPISHKEKLIRVREALKAVDMERFARRTVSDLSGGQQQRVAIARALARRPKVIFADEPTGNLDEANTANICTLLRQISRTSLVVMVTHEERIARFFADRIVTVSDGKIETDSESWERGGLSLANGIYAGDYAEEKTESEGLSLRLLREEGAEPVDITILTLKDRVIIKLNDSRVISCNKNGEAPEISEGKRPVLTLEELAPKEELNSVPPAQESGKAGFSFKMMAAEAARLLKEKGARRIGTWVFLVAMTVLTCLVAGDLIAVSQIDPEDFIETDSHILDITIDRGSELGTEYLNIQDLLNQYIEHLDNSGLEYDFVPRISGTATYSAKLFLQMGYLSELIGRASYVPLSALDESTLIAGRMPENSEEIVVDRWILDKFLSKGGVLQSGIPGAEYFLGRRLNYEKKNYSPTIVGICDGGEPDIYVSDAAFISIGATGHEVIGFSEFKRLNPGKFDDMKIGPEECVMVVNNAGIDYKNRMGGIFKTHTNLTLNIADAVEAETYASLVVADEALPVILRSMVTPHFNIYCKDKPTMKEYMAKGLPENLLDMIQVEVKDENSDAWAAYRRATELKTDARMIVSATVIILSMVMLYLLQRSQVQERIGMLAVYRLLGIEKRKILSIFAMESILLSLKSALPAAAATYLTLLVLQKMPSLEVGIVLPLEAAALVYLGILAYHLLVTLLPVSRLLSLPPARLAGKYDF